MIITLRREPESELRREQNRDRVRQIVSAVFVDEWEENGDALRPADGRLNVGPRHSRVATRGRFSALIAEKRLEDPLKKFLDEVGRPISLSRSLVEFLDHGP